MKYSLTQGHVRLYLRALEWEYENGKTMWCMWKRSSYGQQCESLTQKISSQMVTQPATCSCFCWWTKHT